MRNILNFKNTVAGLSVCIYLLFCGYYPLYGDSIHLRQTNKRISVETIETGIDNITVSTLKAQIYSATTGFNNFTDYPDEITLMNMVRVQCKIVAMLDEKIILKFPKNVVKSLQLDFSAEARPVRQQDYRERATRRYFDDADKRVGQNYRENFNQTPPNPLPKHKSYDDDNDFLGLVSLEEDELKEGHSKQKESVHNARDDIKRELLSEIQGKKSNKEVRKQPGGFDLLDKTLGNSNADTKKEVTVENNNNFEDSNIGRIKGRFLSSGGPLAFCKVRLVRLRKEGVAYYKDTENTKPMQATTDKHGIYVFDNVPPGFHKLYWKPPMETSWIRRVSMEPDVFVKAGKVAYLDDIETNQRILN